MDMGAPQTSWRGPTPEDILKRIAIPVLKYTEWYCENGFHLPLEFEKDPSVWTEILRSIERAFKMVVEGRMPTNEKEDAIRAQGLNYFYKYFSELWK